MHDGGGVVMLRAEQNRPPCSFCGGWEGVGIYTVELCRKVRLACADGMSMFAATTHFNIFRDMLEETLAFSASPGYRGTAPIKRSHRDGVIEIIDAWLDGDKTAHRQAQLRPPP